MLELVTGGSGSGKSAYAESRICEWNRQDQASLLYCNHVSLWGRDRKED